MLKMANAWDRATDSRLAGCPLKIGKYQPPRAVDHAIYDANSEGSPEWFLLKITRRYSGELEPVIISTFVRADQTFEEEDPFCLNGILKKGNILELGEVLEVLTDYQNVTPLIQSFLPVIFED